MPDFAQMGLAMNLALFVVAAAVVWAAGARLSRYAEAISDRTGLGDAVLGVLLLGGVTSLPELAVSLTSASRGNAELAVNNLLGGVAAQVAILAVADFLIGRRALTSVVPDPTVLLQGALNVLLLSAVAMGIVVGDTSVLGVGLWVWGVLAIALYSIRKVALSAGRRPWRAVATRGSPAPEPERHGGGDGGGEAGRKKHDGLGALAAKTAGVGFAILAAGYVVSRTAEAIADETGLGASFVGVFLVAVSTSLPEVSTVLSAVRLGLYTMAISDILGTNLFDIGLLFAVDLAAGGEPVLDRVGPFSAVGAVLGITVTALLLAGLAERSDRTILRMGTDSAAVLVAYVGGLVLLYTLR